MDKTRRKRILIAAGEASGDLHASCLVKAMLELEPNLQFYGMGGEKLREAGVHIIFDISNLSVMGITEVIRHLGHLYHVFKWLEKSLKNDRPDLIILIDYPDFNLRLAKVAKGYNVPVLYYISPQIWAWRTNRIKKIGKLIDKMIVVFPFELSLYEKEGIDVSFVGHPLLDIVKVNKSKEENIKRFGLDEQKTTIGLLPGSRLSEVKRLLPPMVGAAQQLSERFGNLQFILPIAPGLKKEEIVKLTENSKVAITVVDNNIYEVIDISYLLIVASGTATLETAFLSTPMVIIYKMSPLSYLIGRKLVKVPYIGMANIIAGKKVVPELIQDEATAERLTSEVTHMLKDSLYHQSICEELTFIKKKLGDPGASKRAAQIALEMLQH
ncbi:MAG: lipid-A-disaccharide synthase [Deltaproteobacteria bacterium DG_8]|nr:MAG: lipid-A-disaccharide synthase [Deltaproteobacteria bacterium DG_8]